MHSLLKTSSRGHLQTVSRLTPWHSHLHPHRRHVHIKTLRSLIQARLQSHHSIQQSPNLITLSKPQRLFSTTSQKSQPPSTSDASLDLQHETEYHNTISDGDADSKPSWLNHIVEWKPGTIIDRDCDEIRRLLRRVVDSREMSMQQIRGPDNLNVTRLSYHSFMSQHGRWNGKRSQTYLRAVYFFQERERKGIKIRSKVSRPVRELESKQEEEDGDGESAKVEKKKKKKKKKTTARKERIPHSMFTLRKKDMRIEDVKLEGAEEDMVPVFDDDVAVQRKINAYMRQPHVTQASFLRELQAQFLKRPVKLRLVDLEAFRARGFKAKESGAMSVYYAAYVLFEKYRVAQGKEKGLKRMWYERIMAEGGGFVRSR